MTRHLTDGATNHTAGETNGTIRMLAANLFRQLQAHPLRVNSIGSTAIRAGRVSRPDLKTNASMAKTPSKQELLSLPGVAKNRDPATKGFLFQQTMYRIKSPERSLDFYTRVLGFTLLEKLDFAEMKFTLYFLGQYAPQDIPEDASDRIEWVFSRPGCIELTHNWGSEKEDKDPFYHNGNEDPQGFGHVGFDVPDVEAACKRFQDLGVKFVKKPGDGKMKGLAFIEDPDGYWIEIFNSRDNRKLRD